MKVGDVVTLTGTCEPSMTVTDLRGSAVACSWFVGGDLHSAVFDKEALRPPLDRPFRGVAKAVPTDLAESRDWYADLADRARAVADRLRTEAAEAETQALTWDAAVEVYRAALSTLTGDPDWKPKEA